MPSNGSCITYKILNSLIAPRDSTYLLARIKYFTQQTYSCVISETLQNIFLTPGGLLEAPVILRPGLQPTAVVQILALCCLESLARWLTSVPHCVEKFCPCFGSLYWPATWSQLFLYAPWPSGYRSLLEDSSWGLVYGWAFVVFRLRHFRRVLLQ